MRISLSLAVALLAAVGLSAPSWAQQAQILSPGPSLLEVSGSSATAGPSSHHQLFPSAVPYVTSDSVSGAGYSAGANYFLQPTVFTIAFNETQGGTQGAIAQANGDLYFTVSANTTYSLAGLFSSKDVTTPDNLFSEAILTDDTTGTVLFDNNNVSQNTLNASFTLGTLAGDFSQSLSGSLTGNLVAGDVYDLFYYDYTQAVPNADGGSTATGYVSLGIGGPPAPPSTIPLPAAFWPGLAMLGALGACCSIRRVALAQPACARA